MKVKLLLITFIFILLSGCKTMQSNKTEAKNPLYKFMNNVVGLKKGDTIEKVYEIYGEPTEHRILDEKYSFNTVYYKVEDKNIKDDRALSFSYEKDTHKIYTIHVEQAAAIFLKEKNVKDNLYINMHADKIRKLFGPKEFGHVYQLVYEEKEFEVDFYCYEFNNYKCFNYTIYWW